MLITGTNGKRGADVCLLSSSGLLLFGLLPSLCSEEYDREISVLVIREVDLVVSRCDNGRESRIAELSIEKSDEWTDPNSSRLLSLIFSSHGFNDPKVSTLEGPGPVEASMTNIPQFVVIHDLARNTYKHPVVHYVFEDEAIPNNIPRESCILVDMNDSATEVAKAHSLDPTFQITKCRLDTSSNTEANGLTGAGDDTELVNLVIDGVSAHV